MGLHLQGFYWRKEIKKAGSAFGPHEKLTLTGIKWGEKGGLSRESLGLHRTAKKASARPRGSLQLELPIGRGLVLPERARLRTSALLSMPPSTRG